MYAGGEGRDDSRGESILFAALVSKATPVTCSVRTGGSQFYWIKSVAGVSSLSLVVIEYLGSAVQAVAWLALFG